MEGNNAGRTSRVAGLDTIRVIAVVAVLLYHADELLPGGLLGVSVFFVLSGFLITRTLWDELEQTSGRLDLGRFWSRRLRRLAPASLLTVLAIAAVWPAMGLELTARETVSAILPIRNWVLLGGDVAYGASPSPTEHFWSLAVEEQVYLLLPFLVILAHRWISRRRRAAAAFAALGVVSIGAGVVVAAVGDLQVAYLSTWSRAGEVILGAAAGLAATRSVSARRSAGLVIAGAAALAIGFVVFAWPSPEVSMIGIPLAAVATATLCWASLTPGTRWARWGDWSAVRVVADHAYELYLVHVPVFLLLDEYRTGLRGAALLAARFAVAGLLAGALHAVVEPMRRGRLVRRPLALAGAGLVISVTAVTLPSLAGDGGRAVDAMSSAAATRPSPDEADLVAQLTATREPMSTPTTLAASTTTPTAPAPSTIAVPPVPSRSVWFVGDSTLRELDDPTMTEPSLSAALAAADWTVTGGVALRALRTCDEAVWDGREVGADRLELPAVRDAVAEWLAIAPADHVLVQLGVNDITEDDWSPQHFEACVASLMESLPAETSVSWVAPVLGPWCWCESASVHERVGELVAALESVAGQWPNLHVVADAMTLRTRDELRRLLLEDGIHATDEGRALRVEAIVAQLDPQP